MTDSRTRHGRGLAIVILLAVIFFALLALIILKSGNKETKEVATTETLTVLPVRIRIRTEPHARAAVVATATSGERVTMLEDRGAWVHVRTADGLSGWAERANLERTIEQERRLARYASIKRLPPLKGEATERAPLYAGPGIFYPVVGELPEGSEVTVFTRDHEFYAIEHGKTIAYAGVDAIDVSASGGGQLDVATSSSSDAAPLTDTAATMPTDVAQTETIPPPEPTPLEPEPVPQPAPVERSTGVYTSVPPGGTQPQELDRVVPRYPPAARRAGVQGAVVVRGIVRRDGRIDDVQVIKDLPYGLGEEARRVVSRWRFRPATLNGEPIDVYYTVTVNFRLQ